MLSWHSDGSNLPAQLHAAEATAVAEYKQQRLGRTLARDAWRTVASEIIGPFGVVLAVLIVAYAGLLIWTRGLPYVMDNNESFSALWHAANLYNFGLGSSFGLTDESFGRKAEAHPFVHTHQGNFPRVFAFILFVLGARTVESQIAITTFTVGTLALAAQYTFFKIATNRLFAAIACLVFLTDYILVAQWYVDTYRVWHFLFVFGALRCVQGVSYGNRWLWVPLTFLTFACLYYYEFIFVAFVTILTGTYALWLNWGRPSRLLANWVAVFVGALFGVGVLVLQLVNYLGPDGLVTDIYLTYIARNVGGDPRLLAQVAEFYGRHNIVWWQNIVDTASLKALEGFVRSFFAYGFQVLSPVLALVILSLAGGAMLGAVDWNRGTRRWRDARLPWSWPQPAKSRFGMMVRVIGLVGMFALLVRGRALAGLPPEAADIQAPARVLVLVGCAVLVPIFWVTTFRGWQVHQLGPRMAVMGVLLLGVGWLVDHHGEVYEQSLSPVWLDRLSGRVPDALNRMAVAAALGVALTMIHFGTSALVGRVPTRALRGVAVYLACALLAYSIAFYLAPGYLYSGYLVRWAPFLVFIVDVIIALAVYVMVSSVWRALRSNVSTVRAIGPNGHTERSRTERTQLATRLTLAVTAGLLVYLLGFWIHVQRTYLELLPPTHFAFLRRLAEPPYVGESFVVTMYAAPVAWYTGQWAYHDPEIRFTKVSLTESGFSVRPDMHTYLWLADRLANPDYAQPDYAVCMIPQGFESVANRLAGASAPSCGESELVKLAASGESLVDMRVVEMDDHDYWAIVKIDRDYPPYLEVLPELGADARVEAVAQTSISQLVVSARFRDRQQDGIPLAAPEIRLYGIDPGMCLLAQTRDPSGFTLPASFRGKIRVSVRPRTATKAGAEYFSEPIQVGLQTFVIPNIVTGGTQRIQASTLDEAQQVAAAAGTWAPGAGTFGDFTFEDDIVGSCSYREPAALMPPKDT